MILIRNGEVFGPRRHGPLRHPDRRRQDPGRRKTHRSRRAAGRDRCHRRRAGSPWCRASSTGTSISPAAAAKAVSTPAPRRCSSA
ncbi:MAG: hypothetical protein MZV70_28635 [Desulfobacterales bacterium]|nr:hypothetical protein [Desulfobacterales bacterium]